MTKEKKYIVITKMDLSVPKDQAFECASKDKVLVNAIYEYRKYLEKEGKEIFSRVDNILVCEDGYYFAFYEDELERAERDMPGGIDNPIPYKGKDRRMKIHVVKESGELVEVDLVDLLAMKHCPNPKKYKYTWFIDGNPENTAPENIYWCNKFTQWLCKTFKIKGKW